MKLLFSFILLSLFVLTAHAGAPLTLSSPSPAIPSSLQAGTTNEYTYTLTNYTSTAIPITPSITGNSSSVSLFGNQAQKVLLPGPDCSVVPANGSCTLAVLISPTSDDAAGIDDTLNIHFDGRLPGNLTSPIMVNAPFAYIGEITGGAIDACRINSLGALVDCNFYASASEGSYLYGLTVNATGSYLYAASTVNGHSVTYCPLLAGIPGTCVVTGSNFTSPTSIALSPNGLYAYVLNYYENAVTTCQLNNGALVNCQAGEALATLDNAIVIMLNPAGAITTAGTIAYLSNISNNTVSYCQVDPQTGVLSTCLTTGSGFSDPTGMAINPAGTQLYVTNANAHTVSVCTINSDGTLTPCNVSDALFNQPTSIAFNSAGTKAYVTNYGDANVSMCDILPETGALASSCTLVLSDIASFGMTIH